MAYITQYQADQDQQARKDAIYKGAGDAVSSIFQNQEVNRRRALDERRAKDALSMELSKSGANSQEIADYNETGNLNPIFDRNSRIAEAARLRAITDADRNARKDESIINKNNRNPSANKMSDADKISTKLKEEIEQKGSVGQQAIDRKYAENYNNFSSKGIVNSQKSIQQLEEIQKELEKDQGFGEAGGTTLPIPDMLRSNNAIRRRDTVSNAAVSSLKEIFGGNPTEGERAAIAKDYYNDSLSNKDNAKILKDKIQQLKAGREEEIRKAKHYEKHGTLRGFNLNASAYGDAKDQSSSKSGSGGSDGQPQQQAPSITPGQAHKGYIFNGGNPANPSSWTKVK
jgi:hypothetical protein